MAAISDAVVIGIVLGLVFGAVCYYLFSRMTQLERKVGLMENILLDLKVTTEQTLLSVTESPDQDQDRTQIHSSYHEAHRMQLNEEEEDHDHDQDQDHDHDQDQPQNSEARDILLEQVSRGRTTPSSVQVEKTNVSVNYEAMTYKELTALAKQQGISGLRNMSKAQVIDAIRKRSGSSSSSGSRESSAQQQPQQPQSQQEQTGLSAWASPLQSFSETTVEELGSAEEANESFGMVADLEEDGQVLTLD